MNNKEWFIDINEVPKPLPKKVINELIEELNNGSKEAREKLIIHNIRLVLHEVSTKFKNTLCDKKDLVSIGLIGLLKAVDTYDVSKGFDITTYASRCIDNEILTYLKKIKKYQNVTSIDDTTFHSKNGSTLKIEDQLNDDTDIAFEYETRDTYRVVRNIVEQLPPKDKRIITTRFGFYDDKVHTYQELADKFQISTSKVSKDLRRIRKVIKEQLLLQDIIGFCNETSQKNKTKERKLEK